MTLWIALMLACGPSTPTPSFGDDDDDGDDDDGGCSPQEWYADADQDGFGTGPALEACDAPAGHAAEAGDCDDADSAVHPEASEQCNGVDDDCDGATDQDDSDLVDGVELFLDADGERVTDPDLQIPAREEAILQVGKRRIVKVVFPEAAGTNAQ